MNTADDVTYVSDDVTYMHDDVTYMYDDVTYVSDDVTGQQCTRATCDIYTHMCMMM